MFIYIRIWPITNKAEKTSRQQTIDINITPKTNTQLPIQLALFPTALFCVLVAAVVATVEGTAPVPVDNPASLPVTCAEAAVA